MSPTHRWAISWAPTSEPGTPSPGVAAVDHVEVWLIDEPERDKNPHLDSS
jgi:hypothetical protein